MRNFLPFWANTTNRIQTPDGKPGMSDKRLKAVSYTHLICMGIGENGHIAFNDPHVADFNDKAWMKVVDLAPQCRLQQVHDGCFPSLNEVPHQAFTLTIPVLMSATYTFCIVPATTKAQAIYNTLYAPVSEKYPSTILRNKENARLYLDMDSASLLPEKYRIITVSYTHLAKSPSSS